jgi:hypothetical protein
MSAPELRPCPFCGGKARILESWLSSNCFCPSCCGELGQCPGENMEQYEQAGFAAEYRTEAEAITAWNTRADLCDPLQDERVKALVEAIEEHATHTLNGNPYNPAMRKVFAARAALTAISKEENL